jgi:hypothetical protein
VPATDDDIITIAESLAKLAALVNMITDRLITVEQKVASLSHAVELVDEMEARQIARDEGRTP